MRDWSDDDYPFPLFWRYICVEYVYHISLYYRALRDFLILLFGYFKGSFRLDNLVHIDIELLDCHESYLFSRVVVSAKWLPSYLEFQGFKYK
ncbi:hypothetical protein V5O48_019441, partial [Marasmius crinis-equi]